MGFNTKYPSIEDLRKKAKKRIPKFAFEYLDGGCNENINLKKNTARIRDIELKPSYIIDHKEVSLKTELFGHTYDAPFGVAPIGMQGLMWPKSAEILAKAAHDHNIPFILSTVTTASIETVSEITEGQAWFQLYHPAEESVTKDLLKRAERASYKVLVILADVPTFGFRPKDIKNGLSMPPRMTLKNIMNILSRPEWAIKTLINGQPNFESLKPYMSKKLDMKQLGKFMDTTFEGRLNEDKIKRIRELWKGKIVLKGAESIHDVESAYRLGIDGVIVSNHGGRQIDMAEAAIDSVKSILPLYKNKLTIMMDSGIRGGADVARVLATGVDFTFLGRSFMYGVSALGQNGGEHTISLLKAQLIQVMEQLSCQNTSDFTGYLIE